MKKTIILCLVAAMLLGMVGCTEPGVDPTLPSGSAGELPDAPKGALTERDGDHVLSVSDYELVFVQSEAGITLEVRDQNGRRMFYQDQMAGIRIRGKGRGIGIETYPEKTFSAPYSALRRENYGYLLEATVRTDNGSEFLVQDQYYVVNDRVFGMQRSVKVLSTHTNDVGFASIVSLKNGEDSKKYSDFDYFIPAILYKDTSNVVDGAIASNLDLNYLYVKETRTGLPMVMVHSSADSYGMALMHLQPEISVGDHVGGGSKGEVNDDLRYGAVGIQMDGGVAANFIYPCTEGPNTYDSGQGNVSRYHTVREGNTHTYKVGLIPTSETEYTDAMVDTYMNAFEAEPKYIADIDMETVYAQNIEIFQAEYREYRFRNEVVAAGLPWSLELPNATNNQGVSFQMGFVGQQLPLGYQLLRYGLRNNDTRAVEQGTNTLIQFISKITQHLQRVVA